MSLDQSSIPGLGKGRLEALTDGIFATVMTVLVLSLSVPVIASDVTGSKLSSEVFTDIEALWPNILGYVLSFLLLAVLWISHHSVFHYVARDGSHVFPVEIRPAFSETPINRLSTKVIVETGHYDALSINNCYPEFFLVLFDRIAFPLD